MSEVVGVGIADGVLEVVRRNGVWVDLDYGGRAVGGSRGRGVRCSRSLRSGDGGSDEGGEEKDLDEAEEKIYVASFFTMRVKKPLSRTLESYFTAEIANNIIVIT